MSDPVPARRPPADRPLSSWAWVVPVLVLAVLPSLGTLAAPLISDDAAALAYVHREGPLVDWDQAQYGMRVVRFWRPLVTTSLDLQEALTGIDPAPLRAFNLLGHLASALLIGVLALRLGAGRLGALAAGGLAASFPDHGGTVTWIVGRVDSLSVPLILLTLVLALGRSRVSLTLSALAALAACASKELGFIAPALVAALALGRGDGLRGCMRCAWPSAAAAGLALVLRRAALGEWVGGYPLSQSLGLGELIDAGRAVSGSLGLMIAAGLAALLLSGPRRVDWRCFAAGLLAGLLALVPLYSLLVDGDLEPQNARVIFLADVLICLAVGAALRPGGRRATLAALLPLVLLAGHRSGLARADAREWAAAGALAEEHVARARAALAGETASERPVLDSTLPSTLGGAYCLAWGAADRFRAPFEATPRPVWPWRLMFAPTLARGRDRPYVYEPRDQLIWPFDPTTRMVPQIPVSVSGQGVSEALRIDEATAALEDGGEVLEIWGSYPLRLEFVVYTELGYEPGTWEGMPEARVETDPQGASTPVRRIALGEVLRLRSVVTLAEALIQAADVGATRAYLEVRAVDDARGIANRPLAASAWIALEWDSDLLQRLDSGR